MKGSDSATLHPFNLLRPNLTRRLASCLGARVPAKPQLTQRPQHSAGETTPLCTGSGRRHNSPIFLIPLHCWAGCTVITPAYSNHLHCTVFDRQDAPVIPGCATYMPLDCRCPRSTPILIWIYGFLFFAPSLCINLESDQVYEKMHCPTTEEPQWELGFRFLLLHS